MVVGGRRSHKAHPPPGWGRRSLVAWGGASLAKNERDAGVGALPTTLLEGVTRESLRHPLFLWFFLFL